MNNFLSFNGTITDCDNDTSWSNKIIMKLVEEKTKEFLLNQLKAKDIVIIIHNKLPDFFVELLALWNLGVCVAVLNPRITSSEINNIKNFLQPTLTIDKDKNYQYEKEIKRNENNFYTIDKNALILFTSGTTGTPKAVVHSFRSLISRFSLNNFFIGTNVLFNTLCLLPFHFGHGLIGNCLSAIYNNCNLFILENSLVNLSKLEYFIKKYNITFLSSVPSLWKSVLKLRKTSSDLENLKRVHIGSAPLSSILWEDVVEWSKGKEVVNTYGITETANWIAGASSNEKIEDGLVGKMWGGYCACLNDKNQIVNKGKGEILLKTPSLMTEYYNNKSLTSKILHDGWYKTGDVGYIENHIIKLIGRTKSEINRAGLKINPEELDLLIERHECINEVCSFGAPDNLLGEKVCVAVVLKENKNITVEDMKIWLGDKISVEKIPENWYFLDSIPKNDRGKINRKSVLDKCINL